jgi:thioredoxin 1
MCGVFITALKEKTKKNMLKVIKFYGERCHPCKLLAPIFNEIKSEINDVTYQDVNVDQDSKLAIQYNVRGVPTIIFEKNGQEVKRVVGLNHKAFLVSLINSYK